MWYLIKRFVFTGVALMLFLFSPVRAYAGVGDWAKALVDQVAEKLYKSCTSLSISMLIKNSGVMKSDYVNDNVRTVYNKTDVDARGNKTDISFHSGASWHLDWTIEALNKLSDGATWSEEGIDSGEATSAYNGFNAITGIGKQSFQKMVNGKPNYSLHLSAMKSFYNAGYFVLMGFQYTTQNTHNSNGPTSARADHVALLAGASDSTGILIADPASGTVRKYEDVSKYNLAYVLLLKNTKTSPLSLDGGQKVGVTQTDVTNIQNATGTTASQAEQIAKGYFSEEQLGSYFKLGEVSIHDLYLGNALRDNLTQENITTLSNWQRNIQSSDSELGYVNYLRLFVLLLGMVLCIYGALLYLGYWFDRLNTLIQLEMLSVLTFGRLHAVNDDGDSNWALDKSGIKRVTHGQIIFISLLSMGFGTLLMTGTFYRVVTAFVNLVMRWLN